MADTVFVDTVTPIVAAWLNDANGHVYHSTPISPATTVHPASVIANTPAGTIASTTVQTALNELDTKKGAVALTLAQFAATTSAQLAGVISDETGTGSLVFSTNPALVTPDLGTPSNLVGTNISGTAAALSIGGNAATATTAVNLSGTPTLPNGTAAVTQAPKDNSTKLATTAYVDSKRVIATAQATTSGTALGYTGIPSWVTRIIVTFRGVSTSGTSPLLLQVGSGTYAVTGYLGGGWSAAGAANYTTGIGLCYTTAATAAWHGQAVLTLCDVANNGWVGTAIMGRSDVTPGQHGGGSIALAGVLDRIQLTTVNGTDTFDAGTFNIMYEG